MTGPLPPKLPVRSVAADSGPAPRTDASFAPQFVEKFQGPLADFQAQRLWVVERAASWSADDDVCRYAGAVLVLWDERVYGVIVLSPEHHRASDVPLREGRLRISLDRDAFKFASLDDAIHGMERAKHALLLRGWIDSTDDPVA